MKVEKNYVECNPACGHDGCCAQLPISWCVGRYCVVCIAGPVAVVSEVRTCDPSQTILSLFVSLSRLGPVSDWYVGIVSWGFNSVEDVYHMRCLTNNIGRWGWRGCKTYMAIRKLIYRKIQVRKRGKTGLNLSLTFKSLAVSLRTTRFNIQKFYMVLAVRWVFCTDIRTDSDFCFVHH